MLNIHGIRATITDGKEEVLVRSGLTIINAPGDTMKIQHKINKYTKQQ